MIDSEKLNTIHLCRAYREKKEECEILRDELTTLRQQSAELVESLKNMKRIVDNRPDSHYLEVFERAELEDANELLSKIKGEKDANRN
ncbi:hypothetical protein GRR94_04080 [Vibrio cholerae]|nr:hypothetical protein [Vibrio cholerae]